MVSVRKQSVMQISSLLPPCPVHSQTREDECELRLFDAHKWSVDVIVTAVIPKLEMVVARVESENIEVDLVDGAFVCTITSITATTSVSSSVCKGSAQWNTG